MNILCKGARARERGGGVEAHKIWRNIRGTRFQVAKSFQNATRAYTKH